MLGKPSNGCAGDVLRRPREARNEFGAMRYFKYRRCWKPGDDGHPDMGDSWWYYEFGSNGTIIRQIILYDKGHRLRYDLDHLGDDYGELLWDVRLDEFDSSQG